MSSQILKDESKVKLYLELRDYTSPNYESSIRQNAIDAILEINPKDKIVLMNLVNATSHFKWQFSKYAKDQIKKQLKSNDMRLLFESLMPELNQNDQTQLKKLLQL